MAYTKKQVGGGVAVAAVAIAGGVALGMKLAKMLKVKRIKKTQVPVIVEGVQAVESVEGQGVEQTVVVAKEQVAMT